LFVKIERIRTDEAMGDGKVTFEKRNHIILPVDSHGSRVLKVYELFDRQEKFFSFLSIEARFLSIPSIDLKILAFAKNGYYQSSF